MPANIRMNSAARIKIARRGWGGPGDITLEPPVVSGVGQAKGFVGDGAAPRTCISDLQRPGRHYANVMSAGPKGSVTILRERVTFLILGVQEILITDRVRGGRLLLTVIRLRAWQLGTLSTSEKQADTSGSVP